MNAPVRFWGRGGGSAKQQTPASPVNTTDNLRSNDRIEAMLGLCHGPIKGLANGNKSFSIGGTPMEANDGSSNFIGASLMVYQGWTPADTIRPMLGGYEDFRGVWQGLTPGAALTFTTQTPGCTSVVLRLAVDKLWRQAVVTVLNQFASDGRTSHSARFNIQYRPVGGVWVNPFPGGEYTVIGKTDTLEIHEVRLVMPNGVVGPFEISVTQITPDLTDAPCKVRVEGYYEIMQGVYGLTRSQNVGVSLASTVSVVRTTQQPPERVDGTIGIDMLDIRLVVNQLVENRPPAGGDPGGTFEDEIECTIEVKRSSLGIWTNPFGGTVKIKGKTSGVPVVFEYRVPVTPVNDSWDVRVTRISGDVANRIREISWESLQEIVGGPARFDGVAVAQVQARASNQFSSIPELEGVYDLKLCKVPVNYDPVTRSYSGIWNGEFKMEWTDNGPWCVYDFVMNDVYGARQFWPELSLDRFSVYEAAQWCDEMVPDGRGGSQPRYTFNCVISEGRGIKEQIRYMAGSFNAVLIDELNGEMRMVVDRDRQAVATFVPENVVDGIFEYSYADIAVRYNDITVKFRNKNLDYESDSRRVFDPDQQALYGRVPFEFVAVGCTDPHEAVRRAAYRLLTSTTEVETVSFTTNRRGLLVRPADTILIGDPDMGRALTGRCVYLDATRTIMYLRDPLYLENGVAYEVTIDVPDATNPRGVVSRRYQLAGYYSGFTQALQLVEALPADLPALAPFTLGAAGSLIGAPKPYRVLSIEEAEGTPDAIRIEAIEINRNKQLAADLASTKAGTLVINIPSALPAPQKVSISTVTRSVNGEAKAVAAIVWEPPGDPRVNVYRVQRRVSGQATWTDVALTRSTRIEMYDIENGVYDFRVGSTYGAETAWVEVYQQRAGLLLPPSDVGRLDLAVLGDMLRLSWPAVPDADLSHYVIRHTPLTGGSAIWPTASIVVERAVGTSVAVPFIAGTYMIKAVDTSGIESNNAASGSTVLTPVGRNVVETLPQHPGWAGTKTNVAIDTGVLKKTGSPETVSTYEFESSDLGRTYLCRLSLAMIGSGERIGVEMDDWPVLSELESMASAPRHLYDFLVEIAIWNGTSWSGWSTFGTGDYIGRRFRVRITFITRDPDIIPTLSQCTLTVDMPDRIQKQLNQAVGVGGTAISYAQPFRATPTLSVTGKNLATGDYIVITGESSSGFTITVKDALGNNVSRLVDWLAVGYGYGDL